jgi:RNA polymerase sigma-70 factor (ECF subfamily)
MDRKGGRLTRPYAAVVLADGDTQGASSEFSACVAENQRRVFQIAYGVLGNAADAEEVSQETFLRAYRKFGSLRDPGQFRAWVNRIAFRLALNRQRGSRRRLARETAWHGASPVDTRDEAQKANERVLVERLRREIEALPEKLRSVLQLSLVEGMDAAAVGAVLGLPAGTVRSRRYAAKKLLLERMK